MSGGTLASIIIPNYNHAAYLADAIESVLAQSYVPVELIVVDDGSTDDSRAVATRYGEQVRYIYQENRGLSAARNTGLAAARGELVAVLDADDLYEPEFLSVMVGLLESHPDAGAAYCGYRFVDDDLAPLPQVEAREIPPGQLYDRLLEGNFLVPEAMLVRRSSYEAVGGFDESLRACEDWDMWLRLAERFRLVGTTRLLARHRVLAGSMSTDPERMRRNRLAVIDSRLQEGTPRHTRARAYAHLTSAIEQLQVGNEIAAGEHLLELAGAAPEMLSTLPVIYELACGPQPKGVRGDIDALDLAESEARLGRLLDRVAREGGLPAARLLARAHQALGILHYGRDEDAAARRHLLHALRLDMALARDRALLGTLVRTLLAPRTRAWLRGRRAGGEGVA